MAESWTAPKFGPWILIIWSRKKSATTYSSPLVSQIRKLRLKEVIYDLPKVIESLRPNLHLKIQVQVPLPSTLLFFNTITWEKGQRDEGDSCSNCYYFSRSRMNCLLVLYMYIYISVSVLGNYPSFIAGNIACSPLVSQCDVCQTGPIRFSIPYFQWEGLLKKGHMVGRDMFLRWHPEADLPNLN